MQRNKEQPVKKKKQITPQSAKAKGRQLQQWAAAQISRITGIEWGPDKSIESRPMGQSGPDVRLGERAQKLFPWTVECKWQESWSVPAWIEQAKQYKKSHVQPWLLIMRRSRMRDPFAVVVIEADVFFDMWEHRLVQERKIEAMRVRLDAMRIKLLEIERG